jgi:hypothetical protein
VLLTVLDRTIDGWHREGSLTPDDAALCGDDAKARGRRQGRRAHLQALALTEVLERMLDAGMLGTRHAQRPHLLMTVDAAEYRAGLGGFLHLPGLQPEPVTAAAIDQVLCDADVTTILTRLGCPTRSGGTADDYAWLQQPAREVLYVGRSRRTATPRQRTALAIRDQHCRFPGCRVTPEGCDAHHVVEWQDGGLTDISAMLLLCKGHHGVVHKAGWTITRRPGYRDGEPDGWDISPPPPRP